MNSILHFCRNLVFRLLYWSAGIFPDIGQIDREAASLSKCAVCLHGSAVAFGNGSNQRKPQSDSAPVLCKAASIKALEDVVNVLRMNAAAVICYLQADLPGNLLSAQSDRVARLRMVERVLDQVFHREARP